MPGDCAGHLAVVDVILHGYLVTVKETKLRSWVTGGYLVTVKDTHSMGEYIW